MKILFLKGAIFFLMLLLVTPVSLCDQANDLTDSLYSFLVGKYDLIGRKPDSMEMYTGKVELKRKDDHLTVIRSINGKTIEGTGKIETVLMDKVQVLRIRFTESGRAYEGTFMIGSDLDNYGRLTGYIYLQEGGTRSAGLEALFIDRGQL